MDCENILLFQPVRASWHVLYGARSTPLIRVSATDPLAKKGVVWLVNGLKNRLTEVVLVVATVFAFFYSLITYPFRHYLATEYETAAIEFDLARFTPQEKYEAEAMVKTYFKKHEDIFGPMSAEAKNKITRKIVSQCARSQKVYGPVVRCWVDHLLETANRDGKKLVFMARDGIPFYRVAIELMKDSKYKEKYPRLTQEGAIVLGHFSRNVMNYAQKSMENQSVFNCYISKELKIKRGDQCIFVDIGFAGSMVKPIRELLPGVKIDFHFLVATSDKAEGFLGNPNHPLPHLETAANNLGVRWVEESHHGNLASAEKLVVGEDQRVHPDTHYPKKVRCEEKFSLPDLIRKFCLRGLVRHAVALPPLSQEEARKARDVFSQTIGAVKNLELPMFLGWDY